MAQPWVPFLPVSCGGPPLLGLNFPIYNKGDDTSKPFHLAMLGSGERGGHQRALESQSRVRWYAVGGAGLQGPTCGGQTQHPCFVALLGDEKRC